MIGSLTLGTNDIDRATEFYDGLFQEIGSRRVMASTTFIAWAVVPDQAALSATKPLDGRTASGPHRRRNRVVELRPKNWIQRS